LVEAAGVEPDISVENAQLADSEIASNSSNASIAKSSVQFTYKDLPELPNFQASPTLVQHAEVLFTIYTLSMCGKWLFRRASPGVSFASDWCFHAMVWVLGQII